MNIMVAPNGVALSPEAQRQAQNPQLQWTLAGVVGGFVRASTNLQQPVEISVSVARSDDVAIVWIAGPWVFHASDLRAGTLTMFCERVRTERAKSALGPQLMPQRGPVTVPRYAMSLLARDQAIPVGIVVQSTADPVPLPMLEVPLPGDVQSMWLASVYVNLAARLGEQPLWAALGTVAQLRATYGEEALLDHVPAAMMQHQIVDDEAVACLVLEQWHRERGGAELEALRAMVAP